MLRRVYNMSNQTIYFKCTTLDGDEEKLYPDQIASIEPIMGKPSDPIGIKVLCSDDEYCGVTWTLFCSKMETVIDIE